MATGTPPLDAILSHLQDLKGPDAAGWYTARCLFHDDHGRPNLRINAHGFKCMRCEEAGNLAALAAKLGLAAASDFDSRIEATYDYQDEHGALLFQTVRLRSPKDFRQRRPDGAGRWEWNLKGARRIPYRLPELIQADRSEIVFITEGEKDVENLRAIGLVATCNPMGAGKWRSEYNAFLRARRVVAVEDNDEEGRKHASDVVRSLSAVTTQAGVLRLPGLPHKGDVSDWLQGGGTRDQLLALAQAAIPSTTSSFKGLVTAKDLMAMTLPEPKWAIPGLLPEGLSILGGKPKTGKSWMALQIALAVASGGRALGQVPVEQGQVLYLALEDHDRRLQDRLGALLGDDPAPAGLAFITHWDKLEEGGLDRLELWLTTNPGTRLVVIDTLAKVRAARSKNENQYDGDYHFAGELKRLADAYNVAILVIHHLRKQEASDPVDALSGTLGLSGAADAILVLKRERGAGAATLFVTGRDLDEQELALNWDIQLGSWALVGDAALARLSMERQEVLELFRREGNRGMGPTLVARYLKKGVSAVKKLLWQMGKDGHLDCSNGLYSLPQYGNRSNESNSGNSGNRGNQASVAVPEVTSVTAGEDASVTARGSDSNLDQADGYRVTTVTALSKKPRALKKRCSGCGREMSTLATSTVCGRCPAEASNG